jgi:hypothetical protein
MSGELKGMENSIPVRMIYIDTKEEVIFKSLAQASRMTGVGAGTLRLALVPMKKRRFKYNNREVAFRLAK